MIIPNLSVQPVCTWCGSTDVSRDAWASWNVQAQCWELATVLDDGFCHHCAKARSLIERPPAADTANPADPSAANLVIAVPPIIAAARTFLALQTQEAPPSERRLAQVLDQIASASHDIAEGEPAEGGRKPPREIEPSPHLLARRFPDLGVYAVVGPLDAVGTPSYPGDAADDLSDLVRDMRETVWRFEHNGEADACRFLSLHRFHWERHLRDLALYLHARRCG
jgi:hypothetical protein